MYRNAAIALVLLCIGTTSLAQRRVVVRPNIIFTNGVPCGWWNVGIWPSWGRFIPSGYFFQPYRSVQRNFYGAISYSKENDSFGYVYNASFRDQALRKAQQYCDADDCQPVVWVRNGCAAVVKGTTNDRLYWALGRSQRTAEFSAQRVCNNQGEEDCIHEGWVCTD